MKYIILPNYVAIMNNHYFFLLDKIKINFTLLVQISFSFNYISKFIKINRKTNYFLLTVEKEKFSYSIDRLSGIKIVNEFRAGWKGSSEMRTKALVEKVDEFTFIH